MVDLLEVAAYVYCADQASTRGGNGVWNYGAKWRRRFLFHIPVREPQIWGSSTVIEALRNTLGFLSDDEYDFNFVKLTNGPPVVKYLDFGPGGVTSFKPDKVILFSGGLDSLAGAVQEAIVKKERVALVSHRSSPKIAKKQKDLLADMMGLSSNNILHVPVWVHKEKPLGKEFTQRTRSFLYASLATVVARIFDLWSIRFYENGVVSINLPISPQVLGGRATRTTHPQVLNGFSDIYSALLQHSFNVENPFLWMTKTEVVRSIRNAGCGELIKHSVSCNHVWEMKTMETHCGICSQCVDRRFATLAAGCSDDEDPEEMYAVDLLRGERKPGESRTMLESFVRTAKTIKGMSETVFFSEFGEVHRVTQQVRGMSVDEAASKILDLYGRHATDVGDVITRGIQKYAGDISEGKVPSSCLLILALPDEYRRPESYMDEQRTPILTLDEIRDGETNKGLIARIVGCGRFDGVNKKVGSRELFFIYLLFKSTRSLGFAGEEITVVGEDEASHELQKWSKAGYLRFTGKDEGKPAYRVQKMWGEFVRQIEKERNLTKLFTDVHKDVDGRRLYGMRLRLNEKQILVPNISALFLRRNS